MASTDEEQLKQTLVSARTLVAGQAAAEFGCLLSMWIARPHGLFAYLSLYLFCFSVPVLANWLLLTEQDATVEVTRFSLHLTAWAILLGGAGLFLFILNITVIGSVIFAGASLVSLFHFNDRNARFAAIARAMAAPIMYFFNQSN